MSTATLCLHAGTQRMGLDELRAMPTPEPTRSWFPVAHARVVDVATKELSDAGYTIKRADYGCYKDGSRFFGVLDLESTITDGVGLAVGLRNSVDKSMRISMCAGNRVFVCDNMAFSSEISVTRKHTRHGERDFGLRMEEAVAKLADFRSAEGQRIERMKSLELTNDRAHALILRANFEKLIPHTLLMGVAQQWGTPAHDWGGQTAWRLFNAFTFAMKESAERNADTYAARTMKLGAMMLRSDYTVAV